MKHVRTSGGDWGRKFIERQMITHLTRRLVTRSQPAFGDYAAAAGGVVLAVGLRKLAGDLVAHTSTFAIFYPVVLVAALLGGARLGLFAMGLSAALVTWIWLPGLHALPVDRQQFVAVFMFFVTAGLMLAAAWVASAAVRNLLAVEERYRLAQEVSLDAFAIMEPLRDEAGRVVDFRWTDTNRAAEALAPPNLRPLVGRRLLEVFPNSEDERLQRYIRLLTSGAPDHVVSSYITDGVERWLESSGVRIGDSISMTFRDVTEVVEARRDLEARVAERTRALEASLEERAKAEAALAQAQRLETVGRLTGGVAHDFNNLLTVIIGGLDMALRKTGQPERVTHLVTAALAAARRGEQLTRQLLAFSRHRETKLEAVSMIEIMEPVESLFRRVVAEAVSLTVEVADDVGYALLDAAQLEAALLNLVVNAADATPAGGAIAVRAERVTVGKDEIPELAAGKYVKVSVVDTGAGMEPEVLRHIFEPYFTTKPIGKGTGLGLAQVFGFVRHCGGGVTVKSAPGEGSNVALFLPAVAAPVSTAVRTTAGSSPPLSLAAGRTVLLVEDESEVRDVSAAMLTELGFTVLTAADAAQALSVIGRAEPIALLISDVIMPGGMSGVDLADAAHDLRPSLAILLTTGYSAGRLEAADRRQWPVLRKPYRAEELAAAVRSVFARTNPSMAEGDAPSRAE